MNTIVINWNEVIMLVIGAFIGIGSSVTMMFIQNINEKFGKMCIYMKFNCLKDSGKKGWGIYDNSEGGLSFCIPTIFEIQNTSKRARIMRDVTLILMKENKVVAKVIQINHIQTTFNKNSEIMHEQEQYYGDANGSYSFVIEAASIKRARCVYLYKVSHKDTEAMAFDSIALQYYDEKNVLKTYRVREYAGWQVKENAVDKDWNYVKNKIKVKMNKS